VVIAQSDQVKPYQRIPLTLDASRRIGTISELDAYLSVQVASTVNPGVASALALNQTPEELSEQ
jgi:hypothetical protein